LHVTCGSCVEGSTGT